MTIEISKASQEKPYLLLKEHYENALKKNQKFIEAISISSFNNSNIASSFLAFVII